VTDRPDQPARPDRSTPYRTYAARPITRAALILLVVGVALAGLWSRWHPDGAVSPAAPRPAPSVQVSGGPSRSG
jgi:hypothetical protein